MSHILPSDAFVVSYEKKNSAESIPTSMYRILSSYNTEDNKRLSLVRWKPLPLPTTTRTVTVLSNTDLALLLSKKENIPIDQNLLVVTNYPPIDGMKDLIIQWRQMRRNINLLMVNHKISEDQTSVHTPYLDLAFNVLQHVSSNTIHLYFDIVFVILMTFIIFL